MGGLLGRDAELARLRAALAPSGFPVVVVLEGEAGIGKTSLAHAVAGERSTRWARAATDAPSFWIWRQALGREIRGDDRFVLFENLRAGLGEDLLVIDDVQWADEPSLRALLHAVRHGHGTGVRVLLTLRTHDSAAGWQAVGPELLAETAVTRQPLGGLDLAASKALLGGRIEGRRAEQAWRQCAGNPFFLRELGLAWQQDIQQVVPTTVVELVRRRTSTLSPETQELVSAAAVLGEELEIAVASRLVGRPAVDCLPAVGEAQRAGLLVSVAPGRVRFSHGLVQSALEEQLGLPRRVQLHRSAAEALEELHRGDDRTWYLSDIARHWAACALGEERVVAAGWARDAAQAAFAALAYEEASRLAQLGLDTGGTALVAASRAELLLLRANSDLAAGRLQPAREACREAAALGDVVGAALTLEPVGDRGWDRDVQDWCTAALATVGADDALRARLLARRTEASIYLDEREDALMTSAQALLLSGGEVTALRARQLALSDPAHLEERTALADRMVDLGQQHGRPSDEMWGLLWRIDTHLERGRISEAVTDATRLAWCVDRLRTPQARWHLGVVRAALAQTRGDLQTAREHGEDAFRSMLALGHPVAFGAWMSLLSLIGHHVGPDPATTAAPPDRGGEVRDQLFMNLGPAYSLTDAGRLDEAEVAYRRAGPPETWSIPPYFLLPVLAAGLHTAAALGDDVTWFGEQLEPHRGRWITSTAGTASTSGPVELHLGIVAAAQARLDTAAVELTDATARARSAGAAGFVVEAEVLLAQVLARAGRQGQARELARTAGREAARLGMAPWVARAAAVGRDPLSPREREVAELVSRGLSNREIAAKLVLSERTAENHVQHILRKLDLTNRSQVVAWMSTRSSSSPDGRQSPRP